MKAQTSTAHRRLLLVLAACAPLHHAAAQDSTGSTGSPATTHTGPGMVPDGAGTSAAAAPSSVHDDDDVWLDAFGAIWEEDMRRGLLAEDEWAWQLGGLYSLNAIDYDESNAKDDGFETEALNPILRGRMGQDTNVWIEGDLDGEDSRWGLREAWIEHELEEHQWLRAGLQRVGLGTEYDTREENFPLVGKGFPSWLDGRNDVGLAWDGYAADWAWFKLAGTTGSGFDQNGNKRRDEELVGRFMLLPEHDPEVGFDGVFGGVGLAWLPSFHDELELATPLEQTVFTTPELNGDGARFVHLEVGARYGGFRAGVETVDGEIEDVNTPGGDDQDFDELGSWSAYTAYNFRGSAPRWYRGGWKGYGPDDHDRGEPLPLELALRYSNADMDRDLFDTGVTTYDPSSQETRTMSVALSAYVTPLTRLALQWSGCIADDDLSTFGGHNRDSSWVLRFDQRF